MAPYPPLETERLRLLPATLDDAPAIQRIFPQWEIVQYLNASVPWPYPEDGALSHLRDVVLPAVARGESWCWTIRPKREPGRLIGLVSLRDGDDDNRGFWLDPDWRGQGLMGEASAAVTDYWFDVLGRAIMSIPKARDNIGSVRISERQGMRIVETREKAYVGGRMLSDTWAITADEWRARRAAR